MTTIDPFGIFIFVQSISALISGIIQRLIPVIDSKQDFKLQYTIYTFIVGAIGFLALLSTYFFKFINPDNAIDYSQINENRKIIDDD